MALEHVQDYVTISDCYDLFNERLFGGQLRGCVLTFEDRGQHFGHYRASGDSSTVRETRSGMKSV